MKNDNFVTFLFRHDKKSKDQAELECLGLFEDKAGGGFVQLTTYSVFKVLAREFQLQQL